MTGRLPLLARRAHKWLALLVGAQLVIWSLTGLYMTAVSIDVIHGDHLVRPAASHAGPAATLIDPLLAVRAVPGGETARLLKMSDRWVYVVSAGSSQSLIDATSGALVRPPSVETIRKSARAMFAGDAALRQLRLVHELPSEVRGRQAPLWVAEFEGWSRPTLYFSAATGELVTKRHQLWRIFDFAWMLHIMDYDERDNVNNWLLRSAAGVAIAFSLAGIWLLPSTFRRRKRRVRT